MNAQRKPRLLFIALAWLACGLYPGCHSGPAYTDDSAYRAIERDADRNSTELAVTGADIAAGVERIDGRAERVKSELDSLGAAIGGSGLEGAEKSALLRQVTVAQREAGALRDEVGILREDAGHLNKRLAEQREISAALSEEHGKREAAAAAQRAELAKKTLEAERYKAAALIRLIIIIALAGAAVGYIAFRLSRLPGRCKRFVSTETGNVL